MSRLRDVLLTLAVCIAVVSTPEVGIAQCKDAVIQESEKRTRIAAPGYSKQIQVARRAALEIYDHGFKGNSGSAINNKVGRPPGMSIAVAVNGELVWAEGFGLADLEQCVPVTPRTRFRIGSTSKPLTSAGAMLLYDQKRLDLDAPIQRYVPTFPAKGQAITTRQLLGHLGGIRDYSAEESSKLDRDVGDKIISGRARWYTIMADGSYRNTPYEDLSYKWAGGGFLSTAEDLARFGSALLKPGFLKQDTLAMIFSRQETSAGKKTKYGLGWFIHDTGDDGTERQFEHSGGVAGSSSWLVVYPDQGVVIAWVQNSNDFRGWPIANVSAPFFSYRK